PAIPPHALVLLSRLRFPDRLSSFFRKQQPTAGNHSMRFQEFQRTRRAHLRRDHARDILLQRNIVDYRLSFSARNDPQRTPKYLALFALPMKADPDSHVSQREGTAEYIPRFQRDVRRKTMPSGRVGSPACISEHADQFDFYSGLSLHQTHRNVHSFAATSWTT